jgi:hypothetical protein
MFQGCPGGSGKTHSTEPWKIRRSTSSIP